tara:strand:- start:4187 stop:5857 length:1671 start_codon:yes stop_codon:yes gene_type:complete
MLENILVLLPIGALGVYIYIVRTKESIQKSGIVLAVLFISAWMMSNQGNDSSILIRLIPFTGLVFSYIFALYLGLRGGKRKTRNKLTKEQKSTSFSFTGGSKDLSIVNPFRGILIVGGAGSGKSRTFMYPIIRQCAEKGFTGVLYDFKSPELMNYAELCYNHSGSSVQVQKIDFKNTLNSQRVNPLSYVQSAIHATNYTQAFIFNLMPEYIQKQDFWSRSMLSIFSGAIWYFRKNEPQLATLPHIFAFFFSTSANKIVEILSQDNEIKGYISSLAEAVEQGAEKQVAGVLGTLKNAIGIYNTPDLFWILSKDETNLNVNDPANPTMLLVGNNSSLADSYAPLCSLIITVSSKLMNEPGKEKSTIIVDESPTIYLPNFEQIPATARSNKIAVVVGAQDISQMNDKYGRDKTEVLISNLGNQFYGRTTNKETAERVVKMWGQQEHIVELSSKSGGRIGSQIGWYGGGRNKSQSIQKRDRVKIQKMTTLESGEFAGLLAEGTTKEFLEQIDLQRDPPGEIEPTKNSYTLEKAQQNFEQIYSDIKGFLNRSPDKSNYEDF